MKYWQNFQSSNTKYKYQFLRFWWNFELTKYSQNATLPKVLQYFTSFLSYFPDPQKISWEITYTMSIFYYALQYYHFFQNFERFNL